MWKCKTTGGNKNRLETVVASDQPTDQATAWIASPSLNSTAVWEDQNVDTGRMHWHLAAGDLDLRSLSDNYGKTLEHIQWLIVILIVFAL